MELGDHGLQHRLGIGGEVQHQIEHGPPLGLVPVEAVDLQDLRGLRDDLLQGLLDGLALFVRVVGGVDAHGQHHAEFLVHVRGDGPGQLVDLPGGHGVVQLHVDRADDGGRAVIVQAQVIGAVDLGIALHQLPQGLGQLLVRPVAGDAAQSLHQHFDAGLDDEAGDDDAQDPLQAQSPEHADPRGHQRGGGKDGVEQRVGAGGHQGLGLELLAPALHIAAHQQLCRHAGRQDDQGNQAVIRRLRVEDLLHRLLQAGQARKQHQHRDEHAGQILDPAVAVGVLLVRPPPGQLGAHDGDHRGQGVAEIVHRVQDDGDGVGRQAHEHLEGHQDQVDAHAYQTGFYDLLGTIHQILSHIMSCR